MDSPQTDRDHISFTATVWAAALLTAWCGWLVFRSSFLVHGQRYFALFDDAMISMVYARNLVDGFGLNWARWGAPVEGFSCPLWTLAMVPANWMPLPDRLTSLVVQLQSVALLAINLFVVRRLTLDHFTSRTARFAIPAVALTAAYFPLNHWSVMGMETALQALLGTLAVKLTLDIAHRDAHRAAALGVVLGAALLVRLDMALLVGCCLVYVLPRLPSEDRRRRLLVVGLPILALAGYQVFRLAYFGDWLPNTYYLKMTGTPVYVRAARGAMAFLDFARPLFLWLIGIIGGVLWLRRDRPQLCLPLAIVGLYSGYVVWIGGDVYDFFAAANRFMAPWVPLLFVVLNGLANEAFDRLPALETLRPRTRRYVVAVGAVAAWLAFNGLLEIQVRRQWPTYLGLERPLFAEKHPALVARSLRLQQLLAKDALVATSWAGLPPYFARDFRWVDFLGYNDHRIARMPANDRLNLDTYQRFDPGHMKWDIPYIVDQVRPDAIYLNGSMENVLAAHGQDYELVEGVFWIRRDSDARSTAKPDGDAGAASGSDEPPVPAAG